MKIVQLKETFIENARVQGECTNNGDFKTGNKASKTLMSIINKLKNDYDMATSFIDDLICINEPSVLIWLSLLAVEIKYRYNDFYNILQSIAQNKSLRLISFSAQKLLEEEFKLRDS